MLTVRISDDLHAQVRKAAGAESVNSFIREAIAEKLGRVQLAAELEELRARVARLEQQRGAQTGA